MVIVGGHRGGGTRHRARRDKDFCLFEEKMCIFMPHWSPLNLLKYASKKYPPNIIPVYPVQYLTS